MYKGKYRIYHKKTNVVYDNAQNWANFHLLIQGMPNTYIIEKFTGKKDNKGKEIYKRVEIQNT